MKKIGFVIVLMCFLMPELSAQVINTIAGNGISGYSGDGGQATNAELKMPNGVAVDASGNIYVADYSNGRVRKINAGGIISTYAGTGSSSGGSVSGQATSANIGDPYSVATDNSGNVYINSPLFGYVYKVNSGGTISNDASGFSLTVGIAADKYGNVYVAGEGANQIYKITTAGSVSVIAGNGTTGYTGDGGQATSAELAAPVGVAVDTAGNIYIGDAGNSVVRKINTSGIISTYVNISGLQGAIAVDIPGNVYVAVGSSGSSVMQITPLGVVSTIAGNGSGGYSGDGGPAVLAGINATSIAVDTTGAIYLGESSNNRIRKITPCPSPLNMSITGSSILCPGNSEILTGTGATSYTWSSNAGGVTTNTANISPSATTTYTLTGMSGTCVATKTITVTVTPILTYTGQTSICAGASTTLTAQGASSYTWSANAGNATTASVAVSPASTTVYTVTGSNSGCTVTNTINVNVYSTVSISGNTSICSGTSNILTASGAATYTWVPGNIHTANFPASPGTTTTYTLTGTNGTCVSTETITVTVYTTPTLSVAGTLSVCSAYNDTLKAMGASTYTWSANAGGATTNTVIVTQANNGPGGGLAVTYTVTGTNGACIAHKTVSVDYYYAPLIYAQTSQTVCAGGTVLSHTLYNPNIRGGTNLIWTNNNTGIGLAAGGNHATSIYGYTAPAVSTPETGTITAWGVSASTGTCAGPSVIFTITVNPSPTVGITGKQTICVGGLSPDTLSATGASTYTWSANAGNAVTNTVVVSPASNAVYTVTGVNSYGCSSNVSTFTVQTSPDINIIGNATVCEGTPTTLTANGAGSYTWSANAGNVTSPGVAVTPTVNSTYTVTGRDSIGCIGTNTLLVTVNPLPIITVNNSSICTGNSYTMTPSGASTYTYIPNGPAVNPTITTNYTVTGTDANGCTGMTTNTVTVNPLPIIAANSGTICAGSNFTIIPGGANTYTYTPNGPVISPTVTENYTVTGTDANGCTGMTTNTVIVNSLPIININNAAICTGNSYTMTPSGASTYTYNPTGPVISPTITANYTVSGTDANGCTGMTTNTVTVNSLPTITANSGTVCAGSNFTISPDGASTYTYNPTGPAVNPTITTNYTVTGTDVNGCIGMATNTVTVNSIPNVLATANTGTICAGNTDVLNATGASTYTWTDNSGSSIGTSVTVAPTINTTYTVTGIDANGCENSDTVTVIVQNCTTTGIKSLNFSSIQLRVYPNPSAGNLIVESDKELGVIKIYDILGNEVYSVYSIQLSIQINIKDFANGIYNLSINGNNIKVLKID